MDLNLDLFQSSLRLQYSGPSQRLEPFLQEYRLLNPITRQREADNNYNDYNHYNKYNKYNNYNHQHA
ncbi:hypothetical protein [Cognataquiflexum aquatile]|uniref:hypothetical protein n=1 Tax=Cognataquiflexum aquatile TaxID=2249427 RepID=UPI0018E59AF0|nr:hypothetical protein [Cognataquiflexum aquatile]